MSNRNSNWERERERQQQAAYEEDVAEILANVGVYEAETEEYTTEEELEEIEFAEESPEEVTARRQQTLHEYLHEVHAGRALWFFQGDARRNVPRLMALYGLTRRQVLEVISNVYSEN